MVSHKCIVVCLAAILLTTEADPIPKTRWVRYAPAYAEGERDTQPNYAYEYAVHDPHSGDNKSQREQRYGDVVKGSYSLAEADGTVRVVNYAADANNGFNAVVQRYGTAVHPSTKALPEKELISKPQLSPIIHSAIPVVGPIFVSKPVVVALMSPLPVAKLSQIPPSVPPFTIRIERKIKGDILTPEKKNTYYIYVDPATLEGGTNYLKPTFRRKTKGKYSTGWIPVQKKEEKKLSRQLGEALAEI